MFHKKDICFILFVMFAFYCNAKATDINVIKHELAGKTSQQLIESGKEYMRLGKRDNALACYTTIIANGLANENSVDKHTMFKAYTSCGIIYSMSASYDRAYDCFMHAKEMSDSSEINQVYNNLAGIHFIYKEYDKALEYVVRGFNWAEKHNEHKDLSNYMHNIMNVYYITGDLQKTEPFIKRFLAIDNSKPDNMWKFTMFLVRGVHDINNGSYNTAVERFADAVKMVKNHQNNNPTISRYAISAYEYMADAYLREGKLNKAIELELKCMQIAEDGSYPALMMYSAENLARLYEQSGNSKMAGIFHERYINLKDSVLDSGTFGKIKDLQFFNEIDYYQKEVTKLATERRERNQMLLAAAIILLLLMVLLFVVVKNNRRLEEHNKLLFQRNQEYMAAFDKEKEEHSKILKYNGSRLEDEGKELLLAKITNAVDSNDAWASPDFSLNMLADMVGRNAHDVSQVINEKMDMNFNTFINKIRINEACKRFADKNNYGKLTIEAVSMSVGFKSYSHFCRTFKKVTGLTPSEYLRMARKQEAEKQARN